MAPVLAWHFVGNALRDGRAIPPDGSVLKQRGKIIPCQNGLHGSVRIIDALCYAPGHIICRTSHSGTIRRDDDKIASSQRTILWRVNGECLLRKFARLCALDVAHLWEMPAILREYLETGDEAKSDAARAAAEACPAAASRTAACAAARAAAWAAAGRGSWGAAGDAAWAAARAVGWGDAGDAACAAACDRLEQMVITAHEEATP